MKTSRTILICIIVTGLLLALTGCSSGPKVEKVNTDDIKAYADPAVEKVFTGISKEDYEMFSEDFDEQMKSALTEAKFKDIVNQLGTYESKEIIGADKAQGYTRAYYKAKFSKFSKDLTFTVVFSDKGDQKISGLFYK